MASRSRCSPRAGPHIAFFTTVQPDACVCLQCVCMYCVCIWVHSANLAHCVCMYCVCICALCNLCLVCVHMCVRERTHVLGIAHTKPLVLLSKSSCLNALRILRCVHSAQLALSFLFKKHFPPNPGPCNVRTMTSDGGVWFLRPPPLPAHTLVPSSQNCIWTTCTLRLARLQSV